MNSNPTYKLDLISTFDFCVNNFLFYFSLFNIYPNIGIREKMNEMSILTPYSHVPNHHNNFQMTILPFNMFSILSINKFEIVNDVGPTHDDK